MPDGLKKPLGEDVQLFVDTLSENNKDVSVLPVARGVAIALYLICLHTHGTPCAGVTRNNAIVARKIYKEVCSRANKTRRTEKEVCWNLDLLRALGDVLEAVAGTLDEAATVGQVRRRLVIATSKKEKRAVVSRAMLLAKLRVLAFVWRLCEHTGCRPATLIEIQLFDEAEWARRHRGRCFLRGSGTQL